jgi:hypothetical protein
MVFSSNLSQSAPSCRGADFTTKLAIASSRWSPCGQLPAAASPLLAEGTQARPIAGRGHQVDRTDQGGACPSNEKLDQSD